MSLPNNAVNPRLRRLTGVKSLVLTGAALAASALTQPCEAQYATTLSTTTGTGTVSAGTLGIATFPNLTNNITSNPLGITNAAAFNSSAGVLYNVGLTYSGGMSQEATWSRSGVSTYSNRTYNYNSTISLSGASYFSSNPSVTQSGQSKSNCTANICVGTIVQGDSPGNTTVTGNSSTSVLIPYTNVNNFIGTGNLTGLNLVEADNSNVVSSQYSKAYLVSNNAISAAFTYSYFAGTDGGGLLTNGSFMNPEIVEAGLGGGAFFYGTQAPAGTASTAATLNVVPNVGWTFNGAGIQQNGSAWTNGTAFNAVSGNQTAFVQGVGSITQAVPGATQRGTYQLSFYAIDRSGNNEDFQIQFGNGTQNEIVLPGADVYASAAWTKYTYNLIWDPAFGTPTVGIVGLNSVGGDNSILVDAVNLAYSNSTVPAPSSLLTLSGGIPWILLATRRLRARKRTA